MKSARYRFGDEVLAHGSPVSQLLIVKSGSVKLQRIKPVQVDVAEEIQNKLTSNTILEPRVRSLLVATSNKDTDFEDIALRNAGQTICEEYIFGEQRAAAYRVIVNSAEATVVTIPFDLIGTTLATFEMFQDDVKQAIEARHQHQKDWIEKIDFKKQKIPVVQSMCSPTTITSEIFQKTFGNKVNPGPRKIHVPKLLQ